MSKYSVTLGEGHEKITGLPAAIIIYGFVAGILLIGFALGAILT